MIGGIGETPPNIKTSKHETSPPPIRRVGHAIACRWTSGQCGTQARNSVPYMTEEHKGLRRMSTQLSVHDSIFGNLVLHDFWLGKCDFGSFPRKGTLMIEPSRSIGLPTDAQKRAYQSFQENGNEVYADFLVMAFRLYTRIAPEYRERFPSRAARTIPDVSAPHALIKLLKKWSCFVPLQRLSAQRVELAFQCTWDPEHDVTVIVAKGQVVAVRME
jgi:hypothetical protein